jgi:hydrogenase/urease accessory protein HupE
LVGYALGFLTATAALHGLGMLAGGRADPTIRADAKLAGAAIAAEVMLTILA